MFLSSFKSTASDLGIQTPNLFTPEKLHPQLFPAALRPAAAPALWIPSPADYTNSQSSKKHGKELR
jgi:hypothetical protein